MLPRNFICFKCVHFNDLSPGCAAFPEGIPEEITSGENKHKEPLPGQENGLTFKRA